MCGEFLFMRQWVSEKVVGSEATLLNSRLPTAFIMSIFGRLYEYSGLTGRRFESFRARQSDYVIFGFRVSGFHVRDLCAQGLKFVLHLEIFKRDEFRCLQRHDFAKQATVLAHLGGQVSGD